MLVIKEVDGIIEFHLKDTIFMYYNKNRNLITVLAVKPSHMSNALFSKNTFRFYNLIKDINDPKLETMTYKQMCSNIHALLKYYNLNIPSSTAIRTT